MHGKFVRLLVAVSRSEARSEARSEGLEPPTFRGLAIRYALAITSETSSRRAATGTEGLTTGCRRCTLRPGRAATTGRGTSATR